MKIKLLLIALLLLICSCNITEVRVTKIVFIWGENNIVTVTGSDLKDNQASQSAEGKAQIPVSAK